MVVIVCGDIVVSLDLYCIRECCFATLSRTGEQRMLRMERKEESCAYSTTLEAFRTSATISTTNTTALASAAYCLT